MVFTDVPNIYCTFFKLILQRWSFLSSKEKDMKIEENTDLYTPKLKTMSTQPLQANASFTQYVLTYKVHITVVIYLYKCLSKSNT